LAGDTAYRAANTGSFGALDYGLAGVHALERSSGYDPNATDLATIRKQNDEWQANHPYLAMGADVAGYAVGPGKLKLGAKLAELGGGRLLARAGGSAAEGAAASGLGALGHGEDLSEAGKEALVGGTIGAVTGALPSKPAPVAGGKTTADLGTDADALYAQLKPKQYLGPGVSNTLDRVTGRIPTGLQANMSDSLQGKVADVQRLARGSPIVTADDIAGYQRALGSKGRNATDQKIVALYKAALDRGVGANTAAAIDDANAAHNIFKTSGEIDKWGANPLKAPAAIAQRLEQRPQFYQQSGVFDALNKIGQMAPKTEPSVSSEVGKAIARHALGAATGAGIGYLTGQGLPGDLVGTALGAAAPAAMSRNRSSAIANQLRAAQHLVATGQSVAPHNFRQTGTIGDWLGYLARQAGYAGGASGSY
jgi:hypothetical protein